MNNTPREDHRTRLTKIIIRQALIELMEEKPVSAITVSELCRVAGIGRTTFYAHYNVPEDVATEIQDEVIAKILTVPDNLNPSSIYDTMLWHCRVTLENRDYCLILSRDHEAMRKFRQRMLAMTTDASILNDFPGDPTPEQSAKRFALLAVSEGCAGIMNDWHERGLKEPPELVARMVTDFAEKNQDWVK